MKIRRKTQRPWMRRGEGVWLAVKRRSARCSLEAALLSLALHAALFFFAGSAVFWRADIKLAVVFRGENVERIQLEKVEPPPVNIQKMKRQNLKLLMVKRTVSSADRSRTFRLPLPPPPKFERTSEVARQDLSSFSMPGRLNMGVSSINFFGARSKGEKIVFILDASKQMMEDVKGGFATYRFAKEEVHKMVDAMPSATLFNVMVYNGRNIDLFRPKMAPATPENRAALKEWIEPINSDPYNVGRIRSEYSPPGIYQSWLGSGVRHWVQAVQAAMEQAADTIFVLCGAVGTYPVPSGGGGEILEGPDPEAMREYREKYAKVQAKAREIFERENAARAEKGLPPKIVHDWTRYIIDELRLTLPDRPAARRSGGSPQQRQRTQMTLVIDHLEAVCSERYFAKDLKAPTIHFVYLIARDAGRFAEYDNIMTLRRVAGEYRGDLETLRGSKTMHNLTY